ncbi:hypothetical protein ABMZ99_29560, partial [Pseudomonas aeruginosa]
MSDFQHAQLDWDENGQPLSRAFGDVYFSRHSGLNETRHVFLATNRLAERFAALGDGEVLCIGETGFGTGLNFLCAWQLFERVGAAGGGPAFVFVVILTQPPPPQRPPPPPIALISPRS